ncbi:MAG: lipoprotein signal peptidase [Bacteroidetes bacterium]|nr:lipoprotein signal peptidase [Bacteroidota bacterium]
MKPTVPTLRYSTAILIILAILIVDQLSKIYVKTHFYPGLAGQIDVAGDWFKLHFLENEGMAFGMKISQSYWGKLVLTLFRLVAVVVGFFVLRKIVDKGYTRGLIICGALILAGAMGNLIDSIFYGMIFSESSYHMAQFVPWGQGYAPLFHGKVVDMFYFPIIQGTYPNWVPGLGGKSFEFFEPVFNVADAAISTGVLVLIFFQKRLMKKLEVEQGNVTV